MLKLNCSVSSAILIALLSTGCASHPFAQEWSWSREDDRVYAAKLSRRSFEQNRERMEKIYAEHPEWEKAVLDDVLIVECESTATATYCVGR